MTTTKTFDMQFIRYFNIFGRITGVAAKHCFAYNNMIVFVVPRYALERALGRENSNLKKLSDIIGKRTRILTEPEGMRDISRFVSVLVAPVQFEKLDVRENENKEKEAVITAGGRENKAMLISRDRARESELKKILEQYFGVKNVRIV